MASIGFQMLRAIATITGSIAASRRLHAQLMAKVCNGAVMVYVHA